MSLEVHASEVLGLAVWTIGHSTRAEAEFKQMLVTHSIGRLVDVRSFPGSRRHPQFNRQQLEASLAEVAVAYFHLPALGGRRRPTPDSLNTAWRNPAFRGYADYMETEQFKRGVDTLLGLAGDKRTAIMCAEALWWRCHRSLIADYLKAQGAVVNHIINEKHTEEHPYTPAAGMVDGRLSYQGLWSGQNGTESNRGS